MPRADDPRITVRFSPEEFEALERAARVRGVTNAGMVRECVARWAAWSASDPAGTKVRMRRRSSPVPVPAASAPSCCGLCGAPDLECWAPKDRLERYGIECPRGMEETPINFIGGRFVKMRERVPSGPPSREQALIAALRRAA